MKFSTDGIFLYFRRACFLSSTARLQQSCHQTGEYFFSLEHLVFFLNTKSLALCMDLINFSTFSSAELNVLLGYISFDKIFENRDMLLSWIFQRLIGRIFVSIF